MLEAERKSLILIVVFFFFFVLPTMISSICTMSLAASLFGQRSIFFSFFNETKLQKAEVSLLWYNCWTNPGFNFDNIESHGATE